MMTALSAPGPGAPTDFSDPQALARRSLGLDGAFSMIVGAVATAAATPIGRAAAVPTWVVRVAGLGTLGWAGTVGLWSLAQDWQTPTRRVLAINTAAAAALVGHASVKGTPAGRTGILALAAAVAGFAAVQMKVLLADQPQPGS